MIMERAPVGVEDDAPVEHGLDRLDARGHVGIPQLQIPPILRPPVLVQVYEEIDAPDQVQFGIQVEVGVNAQPTAAIDFVESSAREIRVRYQTVNTGEMFEPLEQWARVEQVQVVATHVGREVIGLVPSLQIRVRVRSQDTAMLLGGEAREDLFDEVDGQEIVDHDMRKRLRGAVLRGQGARLFVGLILFEEEQLSTTHRR